MGHYVLGHVRDGILFSCAVLLFFLYLAYRLLHWMLARWGKTWAIRGPDDLASLPVLILLLRFLDFCSRLFQTHTAATWNIRPISMASK